ncbi:MAG: OadG family protein [Bacillota bacterium]|nr:OadG family protein [Bacillota bacterium]
MQELSLMERFADPQLFEMMDAGEKTAGALVTTLMGMGITFVVLLLLWGFIAIMTKCLRAADGRKAAKAAAPAVAAAPAAAAAAPAPAPAVQEPAEDPNLAAVIAAAIAASEGPAYVNNLIVRRINRIKGDRTTWSIAGSGDCMESRQV